MPTKTQRGHRRKLRFHSAPNAAPVVTVTLESAPKRPVKRRKCQQRTRRVSPTPARPRSTFRSALAEVRWTDIEERFAAAKSLGEITRIVLQFFKEHENLQGAKSSPVFPIFISSSEIYTMKVPRKRRIYDVLHVLEGIGVIKRARCDEGRRSKSGYFLYYGKAASVQHLAEIKNISAQTIAEFRQSRYPKLTSVVEEDSAIVKFFEKQAAVEKWPCLVTTTVCFLGLLFQQDYQIGMTLPAVSSRLIEARNFVGPSKPSSPWIGTPYNDMHRRVYDVTSILVSCNMINTSLESSRDPSGSCFPRKYVRFNYSIFTDPRVLFAARDSGSQRRISTYGSTLGVMGTTSRRVKSPMPRYANNRLISTPVAGWQSMDAGTAVATSPTFSSAVLGMSDARKNDTANQGSFCYDEATNIALQCGTKPLKCRLIGQSEPHVQDLFSPLGKAQVKSDEWYDESLNQLGVYDAHKLEWDLNWQFKDSCREGGWGLHASTPVSPHTLGQRSQDEMGFGLISHEVTFVKDVSRSTCSD